MTNEPRSILIVDDDENNVEMILMALSRQDFACNPMVAGDGAEALDYLHRREKLQGDNGGPPVLVLLDLKMPRMDGFEFLRELRASETLKMIPAVVFTSSSDERDRRKSYQLGANAYVVKPVDFDEFLAAIHAIGAFWTSVNQPVGRAEADSDFDDRGRRGGCRVE